VPPTFQDSKTSHTSLQQRNCCCVEI